MKVIQLILMVIAGIAKAMMDTIQFHFSRSVMSGWSKQFWDASVSWVNQHNTWIPAFLTDGWHLMQSIFLTCMFAVMATISTTPNSVIRNKWLNYLAWFILLRGVFGIAFVVFYNYILLR